MCISGPTSCGKTYIVQKILQDRLIKPFPERIIYLYRRWQPLYDKICVTVHPTPEFIQGIPADLDKDEFLDPKVNNLLISDDLMSTSSKDKRITELYSEGSHHRNLSVISINQNMYYSKDPTQRRNCHYMILFNNPVDQQPVMTLARQMYPGNPQTLMSKFREATSIPRGYLLVDLKPMTENANRLKPNGLTSKAVNSAVRTCKRKWKNYCATTDSSSSSSDDDNELERRGPTPRRRQMFACHECGQIVSNLQFLIRHVKETHFPQN